jgi:hypothetical protein
MPKLIDIKTGAELRVGDKVVSFAGLPAPEPRHAADIPRAEARGGYGVEPALVAEVELTNRKVRNPLARQREES